MFFSETILTRKGPLANIWLAAHWDRKLTKAQVQSTDIPASVKEIISGTLPPMALRLTGQLLLGTTKIYGRKAKYLWEDCTDALTHLKSKSSAVEKSHDDQLMVGDAAAAASSITLPMTTTLLPDISVDLDELLRNIPQRKAAPQSPRQRPSMEHARDEQPQGFGAMNDDANNPFMMDMQFGGERQSIEVGRRVDSMGEQAVNGLLSSPMHRSSVKDALFDEDALAAAGHDNQDVDWGGNNNDPLLFSSPTTQPKKKAIRKRRNMQPLDPITELSSAEIQAQVRNTRGVLLSEDEGHDGPETPDKRRKAEAIKASQATRILEKPLFGDGGAFAGLDDMFATKMSVLSSPIRNQLDNDVDAAAAGDDFVAVDYEVPAAYEFPTAGQEHAVPEMPVIQGSRETVAMAAHWSSVFASSKSASLPLTNLMTEPKDRRAAATAFFESLVLSTKGVVRLQQSGPYAPIRVTAMRLF